MKTRLFFGFMVIAMLFATNITVGVNDYLLLALIAAVMFFTFGVTLRLQLGGRVLMANNFEHTSEVRAILLKPGLLAKSIAFVISTFFAASFLIILKGIILKHGFIPICIISFLIAVFSYKFLAKSEEQNLEQQSENSILDKNLTKTTAFYAHFAFKIIIAVVLVNFFFAAILTGYDTAYFISADVTLANFDEYVVENSIVFREHNKYSRMLLNAYLLVDSFKLALVNQFISIFSPDTNKVDQFYPIYFLTFIFSLLKLLPLSVGFVFIAKGLSIRAESAQKISGRVVSELRLKFNQRKNAHKDSSM